MRKLKLILGSGRTYVILEMNKFNANAYIPYRLRCDEFTVETTIYKLDKIIPELKKQLLSRYLVTEKDTELSEYSYGHLIRLSDSVREPIQLIYTATNGDDWEIDLIKRQDGKYITKIIDVYQDNYAPDMDRLSSLQRAFTDVIQRQNKTYRKELLQLLKYITDLLQLK